MPHAGYWLARPRFLILPRRTLALRARSTASRSRGHSAASRIAARSHAVHLRLNPLLSCYLRASRERSRAPSHLVPHSHWKSNGSSSSRSNAIEHGSASAASCSNPTRCAEFRPSRFRSSHWKVNAHYTRPGAATGRPSCCSARSGTAMDRGLDYFRVL